MYDDPTQANQIGQDEDPTQGRRVGTLPHEDPTQESRYSANTAPRLKLSH